MTRSALHPQVTTFPPEVQDKLGVYVYRLIDPRNGETFYVGKGRGNRVFAHACAKVAEENLDPKLSRIRRIRAAGFEVGHVIHRHGMTDDIAVEVEAALIDAYPGLTNIAGGSGSGDYGVQHAAEVMERYAAQTAEITHRALLITVNQSIEDRSMYDAVRFAWKLDANKARGAELVMAVQKGLIRGVFVPERWLPASPKHFPGMPLRRGRFGFEGHDADEDIRYQYVGKRTPDEYQKRGAANPIRYTW